MGMLGLDVGLRSWGEMGGRPGFECGVLFIDGSTNGYVE